MKFWRKPLDANLFKAPKGQVHIINDRCKGCGFCVEFCPRHVLAMSDEFNRKGYHIPKVINAADCLNCKLCDMICPDFAIFSTLLPEDNASTNHSDNGMSQESAYSISLPTSEVA